MKKTLLILLIFSLSISTFPQPTFAQTESFSDGSGENHNNQDGQIVLASEESNLPDLSPLTPYDLQITTENGRRILRFTGDFWNRGASAFELRSRPDEQTSPEDYINAYQRLYNKDGSWDDQIVGELFFHEDHDHIHFEDFGMYSLELVKPLQEVPSNVSTKSVKKTTFCMYDTYTLSNETQGPKQPQTYNGCGQDVQGVSVGWVDSYKYNLPDQFVDIQGLPRGIYKLGFTIDPENQLIETAKFNNESSAFFELDSEAGIVRQLASFASFEDNLNNYPDDTLIKSPQSPKVYVIKHGKRRHIPNEEIFNIYNYDWSEIFTISQAEIDAIPYTRIIRVEGRPQIYTLSPEGYTRHILNPEVFTSYGFDSTQVVVVNEEEFSLYPQTDLILKQGSDRVFSTESKKYIAKLSDLEALGYNKESVHVVNEKDFNSYTVKVISENLDVPWEITFLPDGDMLVTQRNGILKRIGNNPAEMTVPSVQEIGEGGLMGMALHPDFENNSLLYLCFTTQQTTNRVERFRLVNNELQSDAMIIENFPAAPYHDGCRIAFGPDDMLYITTGDATNPELAQDRDSLAGKTLRVTDEGEVPSDNPFGTAIWSWGHRNPQGITWDAQGRLWETEHGRSGALSGFDELNLIEPGVNYGWPVIEGDESQEGMRTPVRHSGSDTTWAPAGLAYSNGSLYFAGLRGSALYEARFNEHGEIVSFHEHLKNQYGRLRAVTVGQDGFLYVSTSNEDGRGNPRSGDDKILKIHQDFLKY